MNLASTITIYIPKLWSDADAISGIVRRVFNKKSGKGKGYNAIGSDLVNIIISEARKNAGGFDASHLDEIEDYVQSRLNYLHNTFSKLNSPMKNKSNERADLVGETEDKSAMWFGRTKGHEWSGRRVLKSWVLGDNPCEDCQDNNDEGPIPVSETFPSGDYAPLAHPNCDCGLEYISV